MALHPTILADLTAAAGKAPYYLLQLPEARAQVKQAYLGKLPPVAVASSRELAVPGPAGDIPARVYTPLAPGPHPLAVFFHGSGFTVPDLDSHDDICRHICRQSGCLVASVDYRLPPERRFPAAPDDCLAAVTAQRLREAGVAVLLDRGRGMNHGFLKYIGVLDEATRAMAQATAWLRHTLVAGLSGVATHPGRSTARHSAGAPQRSHGRKPEETQ